MFYYIYYTVNIYYIYYIYCILFWDNLQRKVYVCPIQDRKNLKQMW